MKTVALYDTLDPAADPAATFTLADVAAFHDLMNQVMCGKSCIRNYPLPGSSPEERIDLGRIARYTVA